jgi:hypothetical protein
LDEQENYRIARQQVRRIKAFYLHAMIFVLVNVLLMAINLATSPDKWWSVWPLLGWGVGLVAHGIAVFGFGGIWGPEWEERKIREIVEKRRLG